MKTIQAMKMTLVLSLSFLEMHIVFILQDKAILFFLFGIINGIICFLQFELIFEM